jgi:uncharacterized membrane protein HdeD (DUF308 family)
VPKNSSTETTGLFVGRWWTVLLRGLTAVAFGVIAFTWPHVTIATLVLVFGLYALIHGILSLGAAISGHGEGGSRVLLAIEGIIGLAAGIVTLRSPSTTAMVLVFFIWVWAIATGVLRLAEAFRLRKEISGDLWLALSGVVTVLLGLILLLRPALGAVGLAWIIGGYALLLGLFEILLGRELRAMRQRPRHGSV